MRYIVCGGRDFADRSCLFGVLDAVRHWDETSMSLISGGARGADKLAEQYASYRGVPIDVYPAQWKTYGLSAGPHRNRQMLEKGKPNGVIVFPGGSGTEHMARIALEIEIPVYRVQKDFSIDSLAAFVKVCV